MKLINKLWKTSKKEKTYRNSMSELQLPVWRGLSSLAPPSSSSEGPIGVLPTGTLAELATVEERRALVRPSAPEDLWAERVETMEEGLKREINVNLEKAMEEMDPPSAGVDSRDADWEALFPENLADNLHGVTEDMEEVSTKKRKAVTFPDIIISSDDEDNVDNAPRVSRKCRAIDSSEESNIEGVKGKDKG